MPVSSRDKVKVVAGAHLKSWLATLLCDEPVRHEYRGQFVFKVLRVFPRPDSGSGLPLSVCDANHRILALVSPAAISEFERRERARITQSLVNSQVAVASFTVRYLNDLQVRDMFDGVSFSSQASYFPGYVVLEINELQFFDRDQLILSNAEVVPYLYSNYKYRDRFEAKIYSDSEESDD